jgi:hypothetical protein
MLTDIKFDMRKNILKRRKQNSITLSLFIINMQVDDSKMEELEVTGKKYCENVGLLEFITPEFSVYFENTGFCSFLYLHK